MLARNETIFKWTLYALATALCFLVQESILQRITVLGVIPFIYPLLTAVVPVLEGPTAGAIYSLAVGLVCDLLLPGPLPCFYTLIFPVAGLCAALIAQGLLAAGPLCYLGTSAAAFLLTDLFRCFLLWSRNKAAWEAGLLTMGREFLVSALLILPVYFLFRAVHRRTRMDL